MESDNQCLRNVVQLLIRFFPGKQWTIADVERAHRIGPKSNNFSHPRPIIARLHRWQDKLLILQDRDGRREMADTLNIRLGSDLTDRQSQVIREERSVGRHAYVWKGHIRYNNTRKPPPHHRYLRMNNRSDAAKSPCMEDDQRQWSEQTLTNQQHWSLDTLNPSHTLHQNADANKNDPRELIHSGDRTEGLPWIADMASFPNMSRRKPRESASVQQVPDSHRVESTPKRGSGHEEIEQSAKMIHTCGTLDIANQTSPSPSSKPATDHPKSQRTPRRKIKASVGRLGVRQLPDSDSGEENDLPPAGSNVLPSGGFSVKKYASHPFLPTLDQLVKASNHHTSSETPCGIPNSALPPAADQNHTVTTTPRISASHPDDQPQPCMSGVSSGPAPVSPPNQPGLPAPPAPSASPSADVDITQPGLPVPLPVPPAPSTSPSADMDITQPGLPAPSAPSTPPSAGVHITQPGLPAPPSPSVSHSTDVDSTQTFVKQLADPVMCDIENHSIELPDPHTQPQLLQTDRQNCSLVSETPDRHDRMTRSKTRCKQSHVTDSFPRIGTNISRTEKNDQDQDQDEDT